MKDKPILEDYGITEEDWSKYSESERIQQEKQELNPWFIIFKTIFIGLLLTALVTVLSRVFIHFISGKKIPIFSNQLDYARVIGEIIGFSIGFGIYGYFLVYKLKIRMMNKASSEIMNAFTPKKREMLHKYNIAITEYNDEVQNKEMETIRLEKELQYYKESINSIENNVIYTLNTKDLKNAISELNENYNKSINELFDFVNENEMIKCIGYDSFLTKIELKEMLNFLSNNIDKKIIIYSLVDIDNELINATKINVIDKKEISKICLERLNKEIEEVTQELNKIKEQ